MQKTTIFLLILSISGLLHFTTQALAQNTEITKPAVRHTAPQPDPQNGTFKIKALVENQHQISTIYLWYRNKGEAQFQKIEMHASGERRYSADLTQTEKGVEYYIEVTDTEGLWASDGQQDRPYFFESAMPKPSLASQFSTAKTETEHKKPFWKKTWFWVAVVAVIGGGIALAGSGGDKGEPTGTVNVE